MQLKAELFTIYFLLDILLSKVSLLSFSKNKLRWMKFTQKTKDTHFYLSLFLIFKNENLNSS